MLPVIDIRCRAMHVVGLNVTETKFFARVRNSWYFTFFTAAMADNTTNRKYGIYVRLFLSELYRRGGGTNSPHR